MGRDFYLDAADERKWRNEKMEKGMGERKQQEEREEGTGRKEGCYLRACHGPPCITSLRCFSTDDIVRAGRRTGPGDDVIHNQSEDSEADRVWPAPKANIAGSLKMYFPPLKSLSRCVLCAFS